MGAHLALTTAIPKDPFISYPQILPVRARIRDC